MFFLFELGFTLWEFGDGAYATYFCFESIVGLQTADLTVPYSKEWTSTTLVFSHSSAQRPPQTTHPSLGYESPWLQGVAPHRPKNNHGAKLLLCPEQTSSIAYSL